MIQCFKTYFILCLIGLSTVYADSHRPSEFLNSIKGQKNEGELIYQHYCANCHAKKPIIPLGAPRIEEENDWKLRVQQDVALLFSHTDEGFNAMPPRGGCFECSDKQLVLSIITLVPKKDKKDILNKLLDHIKSK